MNRLANLFVFCLIIGVALAQETEFPKWEKKGLTGDKNIKQHVYTIKDPVFIPGNLDDQGLVTIKVTTDTSVLLCINEKIQLTSGISSCSPSPLTFQWTNTTTTERKSRALDITNTVYLRFNRPYFVSYQFIWDNPSTNTTNLDIFISGKLCGDDKTGPGCGNTVITELKNNEKKDAEIPAGEVQFYTFSSTIQYESASITLSGVNRTESHIFVFGKRGGYPLFANKQPVEGSYDLVGDDGEENTTFSFSYPKADDYWFTVASNDTNPIKYSILLTLGAEASLEKLNATTPAFDTTKENNTIEYEAITTGVAFQYFKFEGADLKIGVAPQSDSDPAPDVFADLDAVPSAQSNLVSNVNGSELAHLVSATQDPRDNGFFWYSFNAVVPERKVQVWYVAINATNAFVLWSAANATCAKNCSDKGVCDETSGICDCEDGYERYDCSDKVFPLVWIILIAIGGAILLAIAIGVPVSCYVKNKKKSGYERV